jgi:hypothetical protein
MVGRGFQARYVPYRVDESLAMVRSGAPDQRAVNIEKD